MKEFVRAPFGVQLNRLALLLYLAFACLGVIALGAFMRAEGIAFLAVVALTSVAALRWSCTRTRTARLAMVIVVVAVPAVFASGVISNQAEATPKSIAAFFGYVFPIGIASLLFLRKKDNDYFKPTQSPAAPTRPAPIPANQLHCLRNATPTSEQATPRSPN